MAEWGAIDEEDLDLLCRVDTPDEAFEQLRRHLMKHHLVPATRAGEPGAGHREDARVDEACTRWTDERQTADRAVPGRLPRPSPRRC